MIEKIKLDRLDGTFQKNKNKPIHRWYPFTEGYSDDFVMSIIKEFADKSTYLVDPFGGSGTTLVTASKYGLKSGYCEINPFLRFVIETKVNATTRLLRSNFPVESYLNNFIDTLTSKHLKKIQIEKSQSEFNKYFDSNNLLTLLKLKRHTEIFFKDVPDLKNIVLLILSSMLVDISFLKRAGDLRYKRKNEIRTFSEEDILKLFQTKLYWVIEDIESEELKTFTDFIGEDALISKPKNKLADLVVTSPPYLNGTNYIRNTKLELWFLGFLKNKTISELHHIGIPSGINHVSSSQKSQTNLPKEILKVVKELENVAYDRRIPKLILQYFDKMNIFFKNLSTYVLPTGYVFIDIGDSIFAGVHIPTHKFLIILAENHGFKLENEYMIRSRRSRKGKYVGQYLLTFRRLNNTQPLKTTLDYFVTSSKKEEESIQEKIKNFQETLPYKNYPFNKRNWGHKYHSLCSYQSKLKPAIAHFLVKIFTKKDDIILDPFGGVGTIPLEAKLLNRSSYMVDLSPTAYIVAKAKLEYVTLKDIKDSFNELIEYITKNKDSNEVLLDIEKYSNFGFNKKLKDYYHIETFKEIIAARNWLKLKTDGKIDNISTPDAFVIAALLHILHGNRPYSLSRRSHPITPLAPTGPFEYRPIKERLWKKINNSYDAEVSTKNVLSKIIYGDAFKISYLINRKIDVIITSPPFIHSTRFHTNNWIRNWFCGWEPSDFAKEKKKFVEVLQEKNLNIYTQLLKEWAKVLKPNGLIIMHLGSTKECDMVEEISKRVPSDLEIIGTAYEFVKDQEAHGLTSQGRTVKHGFLFLKRGE
ncbi:DNA methylase domain protein [Aciduliprofundum boonei T469]|nr:DNA methylase domain protein [Aciduliprofundum boonei T469]